MNKLLLTALAIVPAALAATAAPAARYITVDYSTVSQRDGDDPATAGKTVERTSTVHFTFDRNDVSDFSGPAAFQVTASGLQVGEGFYSAQIAFAASLDAPSFTISPDVTASTIVDTYFAAKYQFPIALPTTLTALTISGADTGAVTYARTFTDAIAPVPEPATWAMMVGGFALVGTGLRRRRMAVGVA